MSSEVYRVFNVPFDDSIEPSHKFSVVATEDGATYVHPTGVDPMGLDENRIKMITDTYNSIDEPLPANPRGWALLALENLSTYSLHQLEDEEERKMVLNWEPEYLIERERSYLDSNLEENQAEQKSPVTAAAEGETCPPATQNISLNLKNRQNAIDTAGYGPMNPDRPNDEFWQKKAARWSTDVNEAKSSRCGNCAAFLITPRIKDCIEAGLGNETGNEAWDTINAGDLGYCEAFDFKCASKRTCDAWIVGGPITEEKQQNG